MASSQWALAPVNKLLTGQQNNLQPKMIINS